MKAAIDDILKYKRPKKGYEYQGIAIFKDPKFEEQLPNIKNPVLIIHGTGDNVLPYGNAELLHKKIPNSKLETYEGVGHLFWIEEPERTVKVISSFLKSPAKL